MKKIALFALAVGLLSALVVGCTPPAEGGDANANSGTEKPAETE